MCSTVQPSACLNDYKQPVGLPVRGWTPRSAIPQSPMTGRYARVEPADAGRHASDLYEAYQGAADERDWTYMSASFFPDLTAYRQYLEQTVAVKGAVYHAIVDLSSGKAVGAAALMRNDPANGVIEIGNIAYSRQLQRSTAGTEALFLLMKRAFDELGYRRLEWKCDALNAASRRAALRLGFRFEGIFRQAVVYKGRNRDTAWFSIIDAEWPAIRHGFEQWLAPRNFDARALQIERLSDLIVQAKVSGLGGP
ncbi:MAG: GNAT family protein [Pusillimonas sp.]